MAHGPLYFHQWSQKSLFKLEGYIFLVLARISTINIIKRCVCLLSNTCLNPLNDLVSKIASNSVHIMKINDFQLVTIAKQLDFVEKEDKKMITLWYIVWCTSARGLIQHFKSFIKNSVHINITHRDEQDKNIWRFFVHIHLNAVYNQCHLVQ